MKVGEYVRTKKRGFQYPQIAQIKSISKDSGYKNQYFIELDHNLLPDMEYKIYEEDIDKSSPNIVDLIKVGDYVNGHLVTKKTKDGFIWLEAYSKDGTLHYVDFINEWGDNIKSIVTKEQFESMEYKVEENK